MDVEDLIRQARSRVQELAAQRGMLHEQLAVAERDYSEAITELTVLEGLAARYGFAPEPSPPPSKPAPAGWVRLNRQEAALRVLNETASPMHLRDIVAYLKREGRTSDTLPLISAALAALKRKGRVRSIGRGTWELAPQPEIPPATPPDLAIMLTGGHV